MMRVSPALLSLFVLLAAAPQDKNPRNANQALEKVKYLVGEWKINATPEEGMKGNSWDEEHSWEYVIDKKKNYTIKGTFKDGAFYKDGLLSYDMKKKKYLFDANLAKGGKAHFEGKYADRMLELVQVTPKGEKDPAKFQRITINILRQTRYLLQVEERKASRKSWTMMVTMAGQRKGVPFVRGNTFAECIITGGIATIPVRHKGKTYYVC